MKLFFQDKALRLPRNQDLILYEGDSNFKYPILGARWRENKHGDPIFVIAFCQCLYHEC